MTKKNYIAHQSKLLPRRIAAYINSQNILAENDGIIVAVSGGADSLALLHILNSIDLPLQLTAVYIDHGLRPAEIPVEIETIKDCCSALTIPFQTAQVNVRKLSEKQKYSLEEAARILRYGSLERIRKKRCAKFIAVGHTADDQVEEFFIRIIRGSGRKSLAGMDFCNKKIIRPLLQEHKYALTSYLTENDITWCVDSSNLKKQFFRNQIRLELLPFLEQKFNPSIRKTLLQTMDVLTSEEKYLEDETQKAFITCVYCSNINGSERCEQITIETRKFLSYHPALRNRILEKACWAMSVRPTYRQIKALLHIIKVPDSIKEIHLSGGVRAEKSSQKLVLCRPLPKGELRGSRQYLPILRQFLPGPGQYSVAEIGKSLTLTRSSLSHLPETEKEILCLDMAKISFPLELRSFKPGERFHPFGAPGTKKISRYLGSRRITAETRNFYPVLLSAGKVMALPGLQIDHHFKISETTQSILLIEWSDIFPGKTELE